MRPAFYDSPSYKKKQSNIAKKNWQKGVYSHLKKRVNRGCANKNCKKSFLTQPAESKKFCCQSCAAKVNNLRRSQGSPLPEKQLVFLYKNGLSANDIALKTGVSANKITYWLKKFGVKKRSLSEAIYRKHNPNGDPFKIKKILTPEEKKLLGIGIGLYWGEGSKKSTNGIQLSNSDPKLIKIFFKFLIKICQVNTQKIKFWLHVFDDTDPKKAKKFWCRQLKVDPEHFYKTTISPSRGKGTYKEKCKYGVLTINFGNIKLKKKLLKMIEKC